MKRFRVKWTEHHEQDIWAEDEDQACELAEVNEHQETYQNAYIKDVSEVCHPGDFERPDEMGIAHAEKENKP